MQNTVIYEEYHVYSKIKVVPDIYDSIENAIQGLQGRTDPLSIEKNVIIKSVVEVYNAGKDVPVVKPTVSFKDVGQAGTYKIASQK